MTVECFSLLRLVLHNAPVYYDVERMKYTKAI